MEEANDFFSFCQVEFHPAKTEKPKIVCAYVCDWCHDEFDLSKKFENVFFFIFSLNSSFSSFCFVFRSDSSYWGTSRQYFQAIDIKGKLQK